MLSCLPFMPSTTIGLPSMRRVTRFELSAPGLPVVITSPSKEDAQPVGCGVAQLRHHVVDSDMDQPRHTLQQSSPSSPVHRCAARLTWRFSCDGSCVLVFAELASNSLYPEMPSARLAPRGRLPKV